MWITALNPRHDWLEACGQIVDNFLTYPQSIHMPKVIHIYPQSIHRVIHSGYPQVIHINDLTNIFLLFNVFD